MLYLRGLLFAVAAYFPRPLSRRRPSKDVDDLYSDDFDFTFTLYLRKLRSRQLEGYLRDVKRRCGAEDKIGRGF